MRKLYWYITTYIKKHGFVFLASILGSIILFVVFFPLITTRVSFKETKYVGIVGEYTLSNLPMEVQKMISVGLTVVNDDKTISSALSERWTTEDEGKTYRFILKGDIEWQNGKPLEPDDVQYNFHDTETIVTPNDIVFKLPDAYSPFPSVVSKPIYKIEKEKYLLFFERPVIIGIGRNRIIDFKQVSGNIKEITLDNSDERTIFRIYLTEREAELAFKKGEIDYLSDLSSAEQFEDWKNVKINKRLRTDRYLAVFFNNNKGIFTKNVRQALSYAVEKTQGESKILGPIDKQSWAYLEGGKAYDKDLGRAVERFMDDIPYEPLNIELTSISLYQSKAENIRHSWIELGDRAFDECQTDDDIKDKERCSNLKISVDIKITNFPDTSDYDLLLSGQEIPVDPDQYFLWHSDQSGNFTSYSNTRIDSLLEKGRKTIDQQERLEIYQEFQQFLLEDPPAIFLENLYSYDIERV
jgi:ABC-type transport system substrate-binding protein